MRGILIVALMFVVVQVNGEELRFEEVWAQPVSDGDQTSVRDVLRHKDRFYFLIQFFSAHSFRQGFALTVFDRDQLGIDFRVIREKQTLWFANYVDSGSVGGENNPPLITNPRLHRIDQHILIGDDKDYYYEFNLDGELLGYHPGFAQKIPQQEAPQVIVGGESRNLPVRLFGSTYNKLFEVGQYVLLFNFEPILRSSTHLIAVERERLAREGQAAPFAVLRAQNEHSRVFISAIEYPSEYFLLQSMSFGFVYYGLYHIVDGPRIEPVTTNITLSRAFPGNWERLPNGNYLYYQIGVDYPTSSYGWLNHLVAYRVHGLPATSAVTPDLWQLLR